MMFAGQMRAAGWILILLTCLPVWSAELTDREKEEFLREAEVVNTRELKVGITNSLRARLRLGDFEHDAHIQQVDEFKPLEQLPSGALINFRDYWGFNIVAYRLDRLLGLHMIPVSVERRYSGSGAAFTWWLDDVQMMERERWEHDIAPPDRWAWNAQMFLVRVFNELTYNSDPNLGNVLILNDWSIRLVDYTRAFNANPNLRQPKNLERISRRLRAKLRDLDHQKVRAACEDYLTKNEVDGLLKRRIKILEHFDKRIERLGEAAVLYGRP